MTVGLSAARSMKGGGKALSLGTKIKRTFVKTMKTFMNKKLLSIIVLSAFVTGVLASGLLGDIAGFIRSSVSGKSVLVATKAARHAAWRPFAGFDTCTAAGLLSADNAEAVTLLDNVPAYGDDISDYVVRKCEGNYYTWKIGSHNWDKYSYFEIQADSYGNDLDDWLFVPVDVPEGGGRLSLGFDAMTSYSDGHNITVMIGTGAAPEAMTVELAHIGNFGTNGLSVARKQTITGAATVDFGGKCWVGIHAASGKSAYMLRIMNLTLTHSPSSQELPEPAGEVFSMHPTEEEFAACHVIDGNGDGNTVVYDVHEGLNGQVYDWPVYYNNRSNPVATEDADEWIVTPAVTVTAVDRLYIASVEATTTSSLSPESFEIVMAKGDDIAAMRAGRVIMNEPVLSHEDYKAYSSKFGVEEPGTYYFGIHIKSSVANGWRIALRDFKVTLTDISAELPAGCSGLTVTPDAAGALKAMVSFTMPRHFINGKEIPADEEFEAVIVSPVAEETVSGKPSEKVGKEIVTAEGANVITVTTRNANGEGLAAKGAVVCGIDIPVNPVVTSTVTDDNMNLHITWPPVTVGQNGGVVSPEGLTYNVYRYYSDGQSAQWVRTAEGLTECGYTYHVPTDAQQLCQLMVSARNTCGESTGDVVSYAAAMLGTPHRMPLDETFEGKAMRYEGLLLDYPDETYTADWALDTPSAVGAGGGPEYALMCLMAEGGKGNGYVELPKFSTLGCGKSRVRLLVYISAATPATTVRIHSTEGRGNGEVLGVIDRNTGSGWCEVVYDIPERYYNKGWVVLSADVECQMDGQVFVLGGYGIYESVANDLAVVRPAMASTYVRLGEEAGFSVMVQNLGTETAHTPVLKAEMYEDNRLVRQLDMDYTPAVLAENEKAEYTGRLFFDGMDHVGKDYSLLFTLPEADANENNNSASCDLHVGVGSLPVAKDFTWVEDADGKRVVLSWENPYSHGFVDNIESYSHGSYDYNLGDWKNYDGDRATTYYSEGLDIPFPGQPKAFQAVNAYLSSIVGMEQPSGDTFLMAYCPEGGTADDWLVSPEVKGGTKVQFYATSLSGAYPETLEVLCSTTDDELDSFRTLTTVVTAQAGWRLYSVSLPDDAKYVALHYASNDQFGICIDDIAYSPVAPSVEITGWNIYRDGELIKENAADCSYMDVPGEDDHTYRYNVAAVGSVGGKQMVFPMSNTICYTRATGIDGIDAGEWKVTAEKGCVTVCGCHGMSVGITDMTGISRYDIADAPESVSVRLSSGIYVVTVNGKSRKVFVP